MSLLSQEETLAIYAASAIWHIAMPLGGSRPLHQIRTFECLLISIGFPDYGQAILAANVVGYSRLMEQDEAGPPAALCW